MLSWEKEATDSSTCSPAGPGSHSMEDPSLLGESPPQTCNEEIPEHTSAWDHQPAGWDRGSADGMSPQMELGGDPFSLQPWSSSTPLDYATPSSSCASFSSAGAELHVPVPPSHVPLIHTPQTDYPARALGAASSWMPNMHTLPVCEAPEQQQQQQQQQQQPPHGLPSLYTLPSLPWPSNSAAPAPKAVQACVACRSSKVSCGNTRPCPRCVRTGRECVDRPVEEVREMKRRKYAWKRSRDHVSTDPSLSGEPHVADSAAPGPSVAASASACTSTSVSRPLPRAGVIPGSAEHYSQLVLASAQSHQHVPCMWWCWQQYRAGDEKVTQICDKLMFSKQLEIILVSLVSKPQGTHAR